MIQAYFMPHLSMTISFENKNQFIWNSKGYLRKGVLLLDMVIVSQGPLGSGSSCTWWSCKVTLH